MDFGQDEFAVMSFSCPELGLEEMLSLARRFGCDGIEPRMDSGHKHGVEVDSDLSFRRKASGTIISHDYIEVVDVTGGWATLDR